MYYRPTVVRNVQLLAASQEIGENWGLAAFEFQDHVFVSGIVIWVE